MFLLEEEETVVHILCVCRVCEIIAKVTRVNVTDVSWQDDIQNKPSTRSDDKEIVGSMVSPEAFAAMLTCSTRPADLPIGVSRAAVVGRLAGRRVEMSRTGFVTFEVCLAGS